jgi:uncharacterized protein YfaA (DUF2138 family)
MPWRQRRAKQVGLYMHHQYETTGGAALSSMVHAQGYSPHLTVRCGPVSMHASRPRKWRSWTRKSRRYGHSHPATLQTDDTVSMLFRLYHCLTVLYSCITQVVDETLATVQAQRSELVEFISQLQVDVKRYY